MSKNFELLTQIENEIRFPIAQSNTAERKHSQVQGALAASGLPAAQQEMNRLVQRLFFPRSGPAYRRIVFCGVEEANSSSTIVAQVAQLLSAQARENVCVIDANPRHGGVSSFYPLAVTLKDEWTGSIAGLCVPVAPKLSILRWPGVRAGRELPPTEELRAAIAELQRSFGYVLVDTAGCLLNDDATVWAHLVGHAILVVEADSTHRTAAAKAKRKIESAGARLAGTVLHNRSFPIPKFVYDLLV